MSVRKTFFLLLGGFYRLLYRIPVIGDPMIRGICRAIAFMSYRSPYGIKTCDSATDLKNGLDRLLRIAGLDVETAAREENRLELLIERCPYGFSRPEHAGPCDAAMDMDRRMFAYCGADLVIDECIPQGAPECRISINIPARSGES